MIRVISTLVGKILEAQSLSQKELAESLDVSVDRIKNLASGRAKNFAQEELLALVNKLGVSPEWLITGEGDMFSPKSIPAGLSVDEEMLLETYRSLSILRKKALLAEILR